MFLKKKGSKNMSADLVINVNPKSIFSEAIKTIRTNLAFSMIDKEIKTILLTSPQSGDGKSFITANLAVAYAQEDKKVLVVDCDLRKGRQHQIFEVMNLTSGGYSNLILNYKDDTKLDKYIINTSNKNIDLLPTGPTPPNPVELLASESNRKLIERIKKDYDVILLDCPPVLGLSDTMIMTKYSDANLIVVSSRRTKIESLDKAKKVFEQVKANITGVVINRASVKDNSYYSYYSNEYYGETSKKNKKKK